MSDDLISKQAMLKHIEKIRQDALMMDDIQEASLIMFGMYLCEEAVRNQPSAQPVVRCRNCKHYKESDVADRKMCCRKDVDGMPVCYDFLPDDWCKYGERKES